MLGWRLSFAFPYTDKALRASLSRAEDEWENYQSTRDRDGIYGYLAAVFELVTWWIKAGRATEYACRAVRFKERHVVDHVPEPFTAIILCTADPEKADYRMRSKWSRALRYAAKYKRLEEPLAAFIKRRGGINRCATRYARRLGRRVAVRGSAV